MGWNCKEVAAAIALVWLAACQSETVCSTARFAAGNASAVHVATCGDDGADGTMARPLRTIAKAVSKAKFGQSIAVAPGRYAESVSLPGGITLVGTGATEVTLAPEGAIGLQVKGEGETTVQGLSIQGATRLGIAVATASLRLTDVGIRGTKKSLTGAGGHGLETHASPQVTLSGVVLEGNAGVGACFFGGGVVSILDPSFLPHPEIEPRSADDTLSTTWSPTTRITDNAGGGLAFVRKDGNAVGILDPSFLVGGANLSGNRLFGLGTWGVPGVLSRSAVQQTQAVDAKAFGDGVLIVADPGAQSQVQVDAGSIVRGNARVGVFVTGSAAVTAAALVANNGHGGVWLQGPDAYGAITADAALRHNAWLGVGAAQGAHLTVEAATIAQTQGLTWASPSGGLAVQIGDGVGIFSGARAKLTGTQLVDNLRAGLLADGAGSASSAQPMPDIVLQAVSISGGQVGLALTAASKQQVPVSWQDGVSFAGVATPLDAASVLTALTAACPDTAACLPGLAAALVP